MKKLFLLSVTVFCFMGGAALSSSSDTLQVPLDYTSIETALNAASEFDVVIVGSGVYYEHDLDFQGKSILLMSEEGAESTIIDCEGLGRGFIFINRETEGARLTGFTIRNGNSLDDGGAILCSGTSSPVISACILENNSGTFYNGGGICCKDGSSPKIINCIIRNNVSTHYGGGLYCTNYSSPEIVDCVFESNSAGDGLKNGGGIYCSMNSSPNIYGCSFIGNTGLNGGGIYCRSGSQPHILNCEIKENIALTSGAGIACFFFADPKIESCTIEGNTASREHSGYGYDAGGGIFCGYFSSPQIFRCAIFNNVALNGGGIDCIGNSSPQIVSSIIAGNTADTDGGGLRLSVLSSPTISNCTITANIAGTDDPLSGYGGGIKNNKAYPTIVNSIIWGNYAQVEGDAIYVSSGSIDVTYSDIEGGWTGKGNIDEDPMFESIDEENYHLSVSSPCISSGTSSGASELDFDGDPIPDTTTKRVDIGADEFPIMDIVNPNVIIGERL